MRLLIYGENTYQSRKTLRAMRDRFSKQRDATGMNICRLASKGTSLDDVAEALFASPFLAEKKMVVLEGFLRRPVADQNTIKDYLGRMPDSTIVIFYEDAGAADLRKSPLFDMLKKERYSQELPVLKGAQLSQYVSDACRSRHVEIAPKAVQMLIAATGGDPWALHQEIDKLCAFVRAQGEKRIDDKVVHAMVTASREDSVFAYLDACLAGNGKEAVRLLEDLMETGTTGIQILSMLLKQFRTLIAVHDLMERGVKDRTEVAQRLSIHPYPASKAMVTCRRFSFAALTALHGHLLEVDRQMKTSSADPAVLLDAFTARLSAARAA